MEPQDLGGGVLLFKNAVEVNHDMLIPYLMELHQKVVAEEFTIIHDEHGNELYAINRSGHRYPIEDIYKVNRIMGFAPDDTSSEKYKFFKSCEDAVYLSLIKYVEKFPMVLPSLWWRTQGHVVGYRNGSSMGYHSDNDVNYQPGAVPDMQVATRHVVGAIIYFNDSVEDEKDIGKYGYIGGELDFVYIGVSYKPKSGDLIMFPSNYMGTHCVKDCFGNTRFAYISYFSQGSEDGKRGIGPAVKTEKITSTQVWMPEIFSDYESFLKEKYKDELINYPHLTLPLNRKNTSNGTTEEAMREKNKNA